MSAISEDNKVLIIAGPTASGKSAVALMLAKKLNGAIINADSMQIYKDLPIVTACPSAADYAAAPHHLYQHMDGSVRCSVALWLKLAARAVAEVRAAGQMPILVGGTGMYLNAAIHGISPIPEVSDEVHQKAQSDLDTYGGAAVKEMLQSLDPVLADRLEAGDSQRLVRALGVARQTGTPLSSWQKLPGEGQIEGKIVTMAILPDRADVYAAIDRRFAQMMGEGGIAEVEQLLARQLDPSLPVMKALGVSAVAVYLRGEYNVEQAIYLAQRDSRHYAKRQMTWIRNNFIANISFKEKLSERNHEKYFSEILKYT